MLRNPFKTLFQRESNVSRSTTLPTGTIEDAHALDTPEIREVVFSPLLPVTAEGTVGSFEEMTEEWQKMRLGEFLYALGYWTWEQKLVKSISLQGFYLHGEVASSNPATSRIYLTELAIMDGQLQGVCSCSRQFDTVMAQGILPMLGAHLPPCKHIAAVLIAYLKEYQMTTKERTLRACVCPVTRQTLRPGSQIFLCQQCGTAYSPEGWEFLLEVDKGRCCNCHNQNSVQSFVLPK